eukprot:scaffold24589_cov113-Isochrysis_galbana.AAC.5
MPCPSALLGSAASRCTTPSPRVANGSAPSPWHAPAIPKAQASADSSTSLNDAAFRGSSWARTAISRGGAHCPARMAG